MSRIIISTLFVAFAFSGAVSLIIPTIPSTKDVAKAQINRGSGIGKGKINGAITWWTANVNADPELTSECKACCAAKAQEIRVNVLAEIDNVADTLIEKIDNTLSILLGGLLVEIWTQLFSTNGLIAGIVLDLETSLEGAKQTCILETVNASSTTVAA